MASDDNTIKWPSSRDIVMNVAGFEEALSSSGNMDRLYEQEMDLLEAVGFDVDLAGAELLGRDVARLCSPIVLAQIRSLLGSQSDPERLVNQMV